MATLTGMANRHILCAVSHLRRYTFWIDDAQGAALKELVQRPGEESAESFHVRQAIREYLERKGITVKAAPRRVQPRRKA